MDMANENRERLLSLIKERALLLLPPGKEIRLASGQLSRFYLDMKMIEMSPEGSHLIGEVMFDLIKDLDIDAIGGLAVGAVPMVTSIAECCYRNQRSIEGFFVRDEVKKHGTMKKIEGRLSANARVVVVDDVITRGESTQNAIDAVIAHGCEVVAIFSIVDRQAGGRERFASLAPYESVFTLSEVVDDVPSHAR